MLFNECGSRKLERIETSKQLGETCCAMKKYEVFGTVVTAADKESAVCKYINNLPDYIRNCKIGNTDGHIIIIVNDDTITFDTIESFDKLSNPHYNGNMGVHGRPSAVRKIMDYLGFLKWLAE
jgi:hypothetical protein